jgi:hypothetical protein
MRLIHSTILAWLNLVGWLLVFILLNSRVSWSAKEDMGCVFVGLVVWLIVCFVAACAVTGRLWRLIRCRYSPNYVVQLKRDLKSNDSPSAQFNALRTLADHCAEPHGFWNSDWWGDRQFQTVRRLLKKRAQMEAARLLTAPESQTEVEPPATPKVPTPKAPPSKAPSPDDTGLILEPLRRGAAETFDRLGEAIKDTMLDWTPDDTDHAEPSEEPLPPLPVELFMEALRGPFEMVLASLIQAINAAPDARAIRDGREHCQALLGSFLDGALELGLQLRIDAALAALPATHPALSGQAWAPWHNADVSLRGPSRSWVEKYRRMKADDSNLF